MADGWFCPDRDLRRAALLQQTALLLRQGLFLDQDGVDGAGGSERRRDPPRHPRLGVGVGSPPRAARGRYVAAAVGSRPHYRPAGRVRVVDDGVLSRGFLGGCSRDCFSGWRLRRCTARRRTSGRWSIWSICCQWSCSWAPCSWSISGSWDWVFGASRWPTWRVTRSPG